MSKILENMQDPSWWFTSVFVGIMVAMLPGFIFPLFNKALSTISSAYRTQSRKRYTQYREKVEIIAKNELHILIRFLLGLLQFTSFGIGMIILSILLLASMIVDPNIYKVVVVFPYIAPICGLSCMYMYFLAFRSISISIDALQLYTMNGPKSASDHH